MNNYGIKGGSHKSLRTQVQQVTGVEEKKEENRMDRS
jgi:hypothetical protein